MIHPSLIVKWPPWVFLGILAAFVMGEARPAQGAPAAAVRIVHIYEHDPSAFTQGLLYHQGFLYESTGLHGKSTLRKVAPETGKVVRIFNLSPQYFGEGLTLWRNRLLQLTWRSRVGFVYDLDTFKLLGSFPYTTEGWGLTANEASLIMSDGSAVLRFLDPDTYEEIGMIEVRDGGVPVAHLNELELVRGEILANVWGKDIVLRISPSSGEVLGTLELGHLRAALGPVRGPDALNGIAYDREKNRLFVTGKFWPKLFQIEIPESGF